MSILLTGQKPKLKFSIIVHLKFGMIVITLYFSVIFIDSDWSNIKVRDVKLYKSLQCWLKNQEEPRESSTNNNRQQGKQNQQGMLSS